jgi:hypothetical protein
MRCIQMASRITRLDCIPWQSFSCCSEWIETTTSALWLARNRDEIDKALVESQPYRSVARQYRVSDDAVLRHKRSHLPATLAAAREAKDLAHSDDLLAQMRDLNERTLKILARAEEAGDLKISLAAIREVRGNQDMIGRMLGELESRQPSHTTNIQFNLETEPIQIKRWICLTGRHPTAQERREILDGVKPRGASIIKCCWK